MSWCVEPRPASPRLTAGQRSRCSSAGLHIRPGCGCTLDALVPTAIVNVLELLQRADRVYALLGIADQRLRAADYAVLHHDKRLHRQLSARLCTLYTCFQYLPWSLSRLSRTYTISANIVLARKTAKPVRMKGGAGNVLQLAHCRAVIDDRSGIAEADLDVRVAFGKVLAAHTNTRGGMVRCGITKLGGRSSSAAERIG